MCNIFCEKTLILMEEYLAFGLLMLLVANVKQMCWRTVPEGHLYTSYVHASACLGGGQSQIYLRLALALFVERRRYWRCCGTPV